MELSKLIALNGYKKYLAWVFPLNIFQNNSHVIWIDLSIKHFFTLRAADIFQNLLLIYERIVSDFWKIDALRHQEVICFLLMNHSNPQCSHFHWQSNNLCFLYLKTIKKTMRNHIFWFLSLWKYKIVNFISIGGKQKN